MNWLLSNEIVRWVVTLGVISLVAERIVRWIFRFIRPEKEIDSIAMAMVKLTEGKGDWDATPLSKFYFYKEGLKLRKRHTKDYVAYFEYKEKEINQQMEQLDFTANFSSAALIELEEIMAKLKKQNKLPDELGILYQKIQAFLTRRHDNIKWQHKIKEILKKTFNRKISKWTNKNE